jgi:predicted O-methyltransferase YrrM
MRLANVDIPGLDEPIPAPVVELIADARRRIAKFDAERPAEIPAFIPSDFELAFRTLLAIHRAHLSTGRRFVEWGSGLGVVTCLAESVGFDAVGIEIEPRLVEMARRLALDHDANVQFACGSFLPANAPICPENFAGIAWLTTEGGDGYDDLESEPDDFDLVFSYPWPGEEQIIFDVFADTAAVGALLLTYHGQDGMKLQRKVKR